MANILVVEDETAIADLILMNLKLIGHHAFHISNGNDVMNYIEIHKPDLIILDIMLPGKDGFELMKEIEPTGVPVIFLTAKEEVSDKITGLKLGADDYMVKPFAMIELITRIETVLKRYKTDSNVFILDNLEVHLDAHIVVSISSLYKELNADNLKMYMEPYGDYYKNQKIYIKLYYNDSLVYSSFPHALSAQPELQIKPGQKSTITRTVDGVLYYFVAGYLDEPYSNIKFIYIKNIQKLVDFKNEMLRYAIFSSVVVFIFLSIFILTLLLKLTGPIQKLNKATEEIAAGHYQKRVKIKSKDEIGELAHNFNMMADSVQTHIQKLSDLTETRQQFINNLAHEMRTPITAIMGYGEFLKYANWNDEERIKAVHYIICQSERMKNMAGKLMDLANLTHENISFKKIDLQEIVELVEHSLSQNIAAKGIRIIRIFQGTKILGDRDLIESLLLNVVENAVRVLPTGGEIKIRTFEEEKELILSIQDNGIGIEESELKMVFEPFYRVDKSRSRAYGGTGLGLALCKQICDLHHAQINVFSKPNAGTKVEIKFTTLKQLDDDSAK